MRTKSRVRAGAIALNHIQSGVRVTGRVRAGKPARSHDR